VPDLIKSHKIAIIGGKSAELSAELGVTTCDLESCDLALFLVSANDGIVSADLEKWRLARDLYIPSLVVICDLGASEIDFEDMSAIASKMLDPVVTPYLVLHSDDGTPAALIELESLRIIDYSSGVKTVREADPEHIELVTEFRSEYLEDLEDAGEDSFSAGLLFPAIPWVEGTRIGLDQIIEFLNQVPITS
jgi:translation elongation factor EF-G